MRVLSVLLLLTALQAKGAWQAVNQPSPATLKLDVIKSDMQSTLVRFEVPGLEIQDKTINGTVYNEVSIPGLSSTSELGMPELPVVAKDFLIPFNSQPSLNIKNVTYKKIKVRPVVPSKGDITRNVDPAQVPYTFSSLYTQRGGQYPQNHFSLSSAFTLRDVQGVNLMVRPVIYTNPGEIEVIQSAEVEITTVSRGAGRLLREKRAIDQGFAKLYSNHFANFNKLKELRDEGEPLAHPVVDTGKLLIITHPKFEEELKPFIEWKTQKGIWVKTVSSREAGSNAEEIKAYITKAYQEDQISYVILVGDSEFVPFFPGKAGNARGNEGDPLYGAIDGTDDYPEVFVSRFSVQKPKELENIVKRTVDYEKEPDNNGDWYSRATGIASDQGSPKDRERMEVIRERLESWHYRDSDQIYDPSASADQVKSALEDGRGFVNYTGHGSETKWVTSNFSNEDILNLSNTGKLPFIVSVACVNGHFAIKEQDSFAETWLKAGTPSRPIGAIAIYASSTNQSWVPPTVGQKAITDLLVDQKLNTVGALFTQGGVAVLEDNSSTAEQTFETWHVFGDGTLQVRTKRPERIKYDGFDRSGRGQNIKIKVGEPGIAAGLTQNGNLMGRGISNEDGDIDMEVQENFAGGPMVLTLTGFDKKPLVKTINL